MAKTVKKKRGRKAMVGTTYRLSVADTWVRLFNKNSKERRTDEELADLMTEEFPHAKAYTIRDVRMFRNRYNRGVLPCQTKPPQNKLRAYKFVGNNRVPQPLWGEKAAKAADAMVAREAKRKAKSKPKAKAKKKPAKKKKVTKTKPTPKKKSTKKK